MNRKRLKGDTGEEDCKQAICALFSVIYDIVRTMVCLYKYQINI